jgi:hypothetical protein
MSKKITVKAETKVESHVRAWINGRSSDYDDGAEGVLKDLFNGGCSSGMVSHLVYTVDCVKFFSRFRRDISAILADTLDDVGGTVDSLFSNPNCMAWDKNDPLAQEYNNRNILAWFGFEEAARAIANRQGIEA